LDYQKQVNFLQQVGEYLATLENVLLCVEPVTRTETRGPNSQQGVLKILRQAGLEGKIKLLTDTYHVSVTEERIAVTFRNVAEDIGCIHISSRSRTWVHNWSGLTPKFFQVVKSTPALEDIPLIMECFSLRSPADFFGMLKCNDLPDVPVMEIFRKGAAKLKQGLGIE